MNKKTKDAIFATLFLTWFFGSIIWMLCAFGSGNVHLGLALFAQYFIIFGFITLFFGKTKFGLVPLFVGFGILTCVGIDALGTENIKMLFTEKVLALTFGTILFLASGTCLLVIPRLIIKGKIKRCTLPIQAECVGFEEEYSSSRMTHKTLYAPIWKFYYNREFHTYCDNVFSNFGLPNYGDLIELFINPKNPEDVYIPTHPSHSKLMDFLSISCLIGGITLLYFLIIEILGILQ